MSDPGETGGPGRTIRVAAALILHDGRMLLVRKRGTSRFMQAGGKLEPGETASAALVRELHEELGLVVEASALEPLGRFSADAANEPGHVVESEVFRLDLAAVLPPGTDPLAAVQPAAELEEVLWFDPLGHDPARPARGDLAPLTEAFVVPTAARLLRQERRERATSFGQAAGDYDRGRPEYPAEAVAWLLPGGAERVLDVGAGTGKLTAVLTRLAPEVIAVDPDPGMLEVLARNQPFVRIERGTGERLPVADDFADAVTFGQSWHWVDPVAGCAEVARVLRPGGRLGLIWNVRDESLPWAADLGRAMRARSAGEQIVADGGPQLVEPFGPLESWTWSWTRRLSLDDLVAMVASRSYVIAAPPAEREAILADVRAVGAAAATDGTVDVPYVTHAYRATVSSRPR
ncbi:methyltransferase domain-containing protein [Spongisporangium articulatum]|uniref:Methyltransferase domain-containing protein n=1 Tax=Spongisporangium articulatum TaxID=3362603 RepID=A0ABW8AKW2_9ACTN